MHNHGTYLAFHVTRATTVEGNIQRHMNVQITYEALDINGFARPHYLVHAAHEVVYDKANNTSESHWNDCTLQSFEINEEYQLVEFVNETLYSGQMSTTESKRLLAALWCLRGMGSALNVAEH